MLALFEIYQRIVRINILQEAPELNELFDLFVEVLHMAVAALDKIQGHHGEVACVQPTANLEKHRTEDDLDAAVEHVERKVEVEFSDHL